MAGVEERLIAGLDRSGGPTACWPWTRSTANGGYGQMSVPYGRGLDYTHRVAHRLWVGDIPPRWIVHHECENPGCANPSHLRAMTVREHRQHHAPTHCPHGHAYAVHGYLRANGHRQCRECARLDAAARRARKAAATPPQDDPTTVEEAA